MIYKFHMIHIMVYQIHCFTNWSQSIVFLEGFLRWVNFWWIFLYKSYTSLQIPRAISRLFKGKNTTYPDVVQCNKTCFPHIVRLSFCMSILMQISWPIWFPAGIYLLKVNNRSTRTRCEICSNRCEICSGVFIVNFEQISYLVIVFLLLTLSRSMPAG